MIAAKKGVFKHQAHWVLAWAPELGPRISAVKMTQVSFNSEGLVDRCRPPCPPARRGKRLEVFRGGVLGPRAIHNDNRPHSL